VEPGSKSASLVDELGDMLKEKGFNYHGCEVLYSGVYGSELTCEIFIGPVYYQRLRHMVSDKYQVRKFSVFLLSDLTFARFMLSSESENHKQSIFCFGNLNLKLSKWELLVISVFFVLATKYL